MRRWAAGVAAIALLGAACCDSAETPGTTRDPVVFAWEAHCLVFLDETAPLTVSHSDYWRFGEVLGDALGPLLQKVYGEDPLPIEDAAAREALERLWAGDGSPDDLWAIDELGSLLVDAARRPVPTWGAT